MGQVGKKILVKFIGSHLIISYIFIHPCRLIHAVRRRVESYIYYPGEQHEQWLVFWKQLQSKGVTENSFCSYPPSFEI